MSKQSAGAVNEDGLMLSGYQKKLKTMKKKYFVLYRDTLSKSARLEYYDNERKFKSGLSPKRVIKLENCFNINRRLDTKYDYVIALSTKDGAFGIVLETEEEMLKWLDILLTIQRRGSNISDTSRPQFEHVWQVFIQKKGLAEDKGVVGSYHVCLTPKSVTFIRIGADKTTSGDVRTTNIEIPLNTIRRCGDSQCLFYMEVGRQSTIGPGEMWMETDDAMIAQNMHRMISSAMSAKTETNVEPMRKRSSSATEASKPLNILHKKPNQQENKNHNSPQSTSTCFGRERCDSFPSRNRTSTECSNQSFTASSTMAARHNMLSGHRPPQYQRHSNSPPITSTVGCSESEESSLSIDEPDDGASFLSYRFNTRSSDGVIPEENTEELTCSENKYNEANVSLCIDANIQEENYVSMAPAKNDKDVVEVKGISKPITSINETKCVPSSISLNCVLKSEIDFKEYSSDNVLNPFPIELDPQLERPTRAYSIGSKVEHNKIKKRLGNANETEQNTIRVRAFSVGSRAKIPRCDLQRTVLFPKYLEEKNFNSNNNLCSGGDSNICNQLLNINANRDKKSTSAPILIHKSHNSADHMSDLMEIDFSKSSHNTSSRIQPPKVKNQFPKNGSGISRDQIKKQDSITISISHDESSVQSFSPSLPSIKTISRTDNGYLEMKPLGNILMKSPTNLPYLSSVAAEYVPSKPKMVDSSVLGNKIGIFEKNNSQHISVVRDDIIEIENAAGGKDNIKDSEVEKPMINKCFGNFGSLTDTVLHKKHTNNLQTNNANTINLSCKYSQLTLGSTTNKEYVKISDDNINNDNKVEDCDPGSFRNNKKVNNKYKKAFSENGKIFHSTSNEYESQSIGKKVPQIKSDGFLQSNKSLNRPAFLHKENHLQNQQNQILSQASKKSSCIASPLSPATLSESTATPTSKYNFPITQASTTNTNEVNHSPINVKTDLNVTSRPPSLGSEHELYYASLDLPPCSTDNIKTQKVDDGTPQTTAEHIHNTYAKIDFDHSSDSSSSSSKNLNT